MLLKFTNPSERSTYSNGKGKASKVTSRIHRKTLKIASKPGKKAPGKKISLGKNQRNFQASRSFPPSTTSLCDNSNDSGLGFEESHHHHPTLALSTTKNINNRSNNYRPLSTLRYSEVIQVPSTVVTPPTTEAAKPALDATGEKVKNATKPSKTTKVNQNMTLPTENEDTCNSEDFSSFYKANGSGSKSNLGASSPTESFYQSSPDKRLSSSGSECSSPTTSTATSPSPTSSNSLENVEALPSSSLHKQFSFGSRDGTAQLQIITQPEQQHRARYQTEGSRGAVKDRSGNGFPVVKLNGYNKPTTLQVFIGNDVGRVSPHIFYQACKVSGKNSTPCSETKTEGTMVIEIELRPENDMTVICDCVGILKERNVDVEHRLGRNHSLAASVTRNKKKSTKCRMVFRAKINDDTPFTEVLQICSNTITCTQPPGVPEISKKSLDSCSVLGGEELFIIGKNFLKDTKVSFVRYDESRQPKKLWEETVQPDKEYLQQTHLICVVPPLPNSESVQDPVHVQIYVTSSSKKSEAHTFIYTPLMKSRSVAQSPESDADQSGLVFTNSQDTNQSVHQQQQLVQNVINMNLAWNDSQVTSADMMPPPLVMPRKPSFSKNLSDASTTEAITLKTEYIDQTSINGEVQPEASTSPTAGLQPTTPVTMFNANSLIVDSGLQNPFVTQDTQSLMTSSQVQDIFEGFKMEPNDGNIELHHIKSEQSPDHVIVSSALLPSPPPQQDMNSAQQQVVENFLNLIVQSTVMNEPTMVSQIPSHHHLPQDIILNSPSTVAPTSNVIQSEQHVNPPPSLILNSAISPSSMMCEPNLMTVQMVQDEINSIENAAASSIVSNAVSDATAETQAVVKQMIAQAAAEMLSENSTETQASINNFISNTLGSNMMTPSTEQQQLANSQQLQEMLAQELNAATTNLMLEVTKKEEPLVEAQVNERLTNAVPVSAPPPAITQPFSPATQEFSAMSESDLISFINPSVFM